MYNPYKLYSATFLIVMFLYSLGWSELYPNLSMEVIIFILLTSILMILISTFMNRVKRIEWEEIKQDNNIGFYSRVLFLGYFFDFFYAKKIPFIMITVLRLLPKRVWKMT